MDLACFPSVAVTGLAPTAGPLDGSTTVEVTGGPFAPPSAPAAAYCRLGGVVIDATAHQDRLVCAPAPPLTTGNYQASRVARVQISLNGQDFSPPALEAPTFTYYETPYTQQIRPTAGPVGGGTPLTLSGLRLSAGGWATASTVLLRWRSNGTTHGLNTSALDAAGAWLVTEPTFPSPHGCRGRCCKVSSDGAALEPCAGAGAGAEGGGAEGGDQCSSCMLSLELSLNRRDFQRLVPTITFALYNASGLTLLSASPRSGPTSGGTVVTLRGSDLTPAGASAAEMRCGFGNVSVPAREAAADGSWVACAPTPSLTPSENGSVAVSVAPNGVDFERGVAPLHFLLYADPVASALLPAGGPTAGGTSVRVRGVGFAPGPHTDLSLARCRFGRREPGAVVNVSGFDADGGGLGCLPTPPTTLYGIGVDKELQFSLNGQQYAPLPGVPFRYYVPPLVSAVWPTGGPARGGSTVTVTGAGFDRFGHVTADEELAAAAAAGGGANASRPAGKALCVFGASCFDANDVFRGVGCDEPAGLTSPDGATASAATMVSASVMLCRSPAATAAREGSRGRVSSRVSLALNAHNFVHAGTPLFVQYSGVVLSAVQPTVGPPRGGVELRVAGANFGVFGETTHARCRFRAWQPLVAGAGLGVGRGSRAAGAAGAAGQQVVAGAALGVGSAPVEVPVLLRREAAVVCHTPRLPAGTVEVEVALNGRDFEAASPALTHTLACEQHATHAACVSDHSCGSCADERPHCYPDERVGCYPELVTQTRLGCLQCHADGCGAGPATGTCARWAFETPLLEPPTDAAEALALSLANATEPDALSASASGVLLPGVFRFYRVRPPHGMARIVVSALVGRGHVRLYARRGEPPGASREEHDLASDPDGLPQTVIVPQSMISCAPADAAAGGGSSEPACDEWVFGVLGNGYLPRGDPNASPPDDSSDFALSVRLEPAAADFACAECGGECGGACGWAAGGSAQFVRDDEGSHVARLTNGTGQAGALWLREPQPYGAGFSAKFSFRISGQSECTLPTQMFGSNASAAAPSANASFTPYAELVAAGGAVTNYLTDDPRLPYEAMPPVRGVPQHIADALGVEGSPTARYGSFPALPGSGVRAGFMPYVRGPECPEADARIGGEGFAFVLQSDGVAAVGCSHTGVGYASTATCNASIATSVAVQLDVYSNLRTVERTSCFETNLTTGACLPDATRTTHALEWDRDHALSVFVGGENGPSSTLLTTLLDRKDPTFRFDDGAEHEVSLRYVPPPPRSGILGVLEVFLDKWPRPALSVRLALNASFPGSARGNATAYVGLTASTGSTSERHDVRSFSYCHRVGCTAV